jgi:Xaa-Pro aminopeptidase
MDGNKERNRNDAGGNGNGGDIVVNSGVNGSGDIGINGSGATGGSIFSGRIAQLREVMAAAEIDAYIVADADPHATEYPAAHWRARSWLCGFTGSNGILAVTQDTAALWTDGRYYAQAEIQLRGAGVTLMKAGEPDTPGYPQWVSQTVRRGGAVGANGRVLTCAAHTALADALAQNSSSLTIDLDLVGQIWTDGRPALPDVPVFLHGLQYAGAPASEKIAAVRREMAKCGASHAIVAGLEDVAWLFNIRGGDIPNLPVAYAYAMLSGSEANIYVEPAKVPAGARAALESEGVAIRGYSDGSLESDLGSLPRGARVCCDHGKLNALLAGRIGKNAACVPAQELTMRLKAIKNEAEIQNCRVCHERDGAAMVKFLIWLERAVKRGALRELDAAEKLRGLRAAVPDNRGESFAPIVGYGPHGAMMHYAPDGGGGAQIADEGLMVVDSGGQYLGGTTDITRTVVFGSVTDEQKYDFTMTLKAHIALASARFLYGASGVSLDAIARKVMWDEAMDYKSGTGHGVGSFLSVHESPPSISMRPESMLSRLEENMIVSIEPGVYREGRHGVRTENLARVVRDVSNEFGKFMRFEIVSYCPISLRGIDEAMLDGKEKSWLNSYHGIVYKKLAPLLDAGERAWLALNTRPI